jgi:hypothetical protein
MRPDSPVSPPAKQDGFATRPLIANARAKPGAWPPAEAAPRPVVVTDVRLPFESVVVLWFQVFIIQVLVAVAVLFLLVVYGVI